MQPSWREREREKQDQEDQEEEEEEEVDRFTSQSEEGARTETAANTDGLDRLIKSTKELFGIQFGSSSNNQPLVLEQHIFDSQ